MTDRKTQITVCMLSILLFILSASWFISITLNYGFMLIDPLSFFVLIVSCLSFFIVVVSLHILLKDIRYELNELKEKEKNVRDVYRYNQLLNPPDTDMDN